MFDHSSAYPVAIDIGTDSVHAAQLADSHRGPVIKALASKNLNSVNGLTTDIEDSLTAFLKEVAKDKRFSGKRSVLHLPPHCISSFPLNIHTEEDQDWKKPFAREVLRLYLLPPG